MYLEEVASSDLKSNYSKNINLQLSLGKAKVVQNLGTEPNFYEYDNNMSMITNLDVMIFGENVNLEMQAERRLNQKISFFI